MYSVCWCCMQVCMKCAQIHIYIYNANTSKLKYIFILEFLVAVRLVTLRYIPSQTRVVIRPARGTKKRRAFLARQRIGYLHQYHNGPMQKSVTVVIPIPQRYSDIEFHRLYINSTTIQNTTTVTTLSLFTPPNQLVVAHFLLFFNS